MTAENYTWIFHKLKSNGSFENYRSRLFHNWSCNLAIMMFAFWMIFAVSGTFRWNRKNLLQLKTTREYFINLKVMVVLKTINQSLSISDLLTLLSWCLDRWNFTWKQPSWYFFRNGNLTDWSGLHKSYVNAVYFSNIYNQGELMWKCVQCNDRMLKRTSSIINALW